MIRAWLEIRVFFVVGILYWKLPSTVLLSAMETINTVLFHILLKGLRSLLIR